MNSAREGLPRERAAGLPARVLPAMRNGARAILVMLAGKVRKNAEQRADNGRGTFPALTAFSRRGDFLRSVSGVVAFPECGDRAR